MNVLRFRSAVAIACLASSALGADSAEDPALAAARRIEEARIATVERVFPTVVAVFPGPITAGGGSGVIVHPDGYAVTNYHVVMTNKKVKGGLADGRLYDAEVLGLDPFGDIALFRMKGRPFEWSAMGDSDRVAVGQWALAIGNPFLLATDFKPTVTLGIVSGVHRYLPGSGMLDGNKNALTYPDCIQVDASINPGNSGGPLFNLAGEVVGINGRISLRDRGRMNIGVGFAISINQVKSFLSDMRAGKDCRHATLEATVETRSIGEVIFDAVQESGPADKAGIQPGDRLLEFDGRTVRTQNEFLNYVSVLPAGRRAKVVWSHRGERREAVVKLAALPLGDKGVDFKPDAAQIRTETRVTLDGFRRWCGADKAEPPARQAFEAELKLADGIPAAAREAYGNRIRTMAGEVLGTYRFVAAQEPERTLRSAKLIGGDKLDGRFTDVVEVEAGGGKLHWHFDYLWADRPEDRGRLHAVVSTDDPSAEWFLVPAADAAPATGSPVRIPSVWKVFRNQTPVGEVIVRSATSDAGEAKVEWK
jgi:S1-C subfamily serine protease